MSDPARPDRDYDVLAEDALAVGELAGVMAGCWFVLVARLGDGFHAVNDRCSHAAARLSSGQVRGNAIMCPRHGARFDLASGKCAGLPYPPIRCFPVRIAGGRVVVSVPASPPELSELPIG